MPAHRSPKKQSPAQFDVFSRVTGMYFPSTKPTYESVDITTIHHSHKPRDRHPVLDTILNSHNRQLPIHQTSAFINDADGHRHQFLVAYTYSPHLNKNDALRAICGSGWRGELVVVKCGKQNSVINLLSADHEVAKAVVTEYA